MSERGFIQFTLILCSFLLLVTVTLAFAPSASDYALEEKGRTEVRAEAVKAGVAEYYLDEKNEKAFRFINKEKGK